MMKKIIMRYAVRNAFTALILLGGLTTHALAVTLEPREVLLQQLQEVNSKLGQTEAVNHQDERIREKAQYWGLTTEEWAEFEKIKEVGGRGYWTPNLDPLTTLGVEAKTEEARLHYARLLAQKEHERVTKELAFQLTYDKAFKQLFPDQLPIELEDNPNFVAPVNYAGNRLVLFVDVNDPVRSVNVLQTVLKTGKETDIYLLNTKQSDDVVQAWAVKNNVPVERVKTGSITLNHNFGQWEDIAKGNIPALMQLQNGNKWRQVEIKGQ